MRISDWKFEELVRVHAWLHTSQYIDNPPRKVSDFDNYFWEALKNHTKKEWMEIIRDKPEVIKLGSGAVSHNDRPVRKEPKESNSFLSIVCGKPRDKRYVKECNVSL